MSTQDILDVIPAPHSPEELELIVRLAQSISHFPKMNSAEQQSVLQKLQAYECHTQVVKLLQWRIQNAELGEAQIFADFLWLMRIQYLGLENLPGYIETAKLCLNRLSLPFSTIRIHMIEEILGHENFSEQAYVYDELVPHLRDVSQRVIMLERLSLLYEKKLFKDTKVEPVYAKIIALDAKNLKALRFYKLWYTQAARWQDVAHQLETLIEAALNPHEKQRAAHELAQLYLYNLNQPAQAREIIYTYCENSALDITQTMIEVLERLDAHDELLKCLVSLESSAKSPTDQAHLKLKQGMACLKAKRIKEAVQYLKTSIRLDPKFLLGYEGLVTVLMENGNTQDIFETLLQLRDSVSLATSKKHITEFLEKYQQG